MPDADLLRILTDLRQKREQLDKLIFRRDDANAKTEVIAEPDPSGSAVPPAGPLPETRVP